MSANARMEEDREELLEELAFMSKQLDRARMFVSSAKDKLRGEKERVPRWMHIGGA